MKEMTPIETTAAQMVAAGMNWGDLGREIHKAAISVLLRRHKGNLSRTARSLGMHRNTLSRAMEVLSIDDLPRQIRAEVQAQQALNFSRARERAKQGQHQWPPVSRVA
jgi:hypothetical protein